MKKILISLFALVLCLAMLASCNDSKKTEGEEITELEWERMKSGNFSNFTGERHVTDVIYGDSLIYFWLDGDQWRIRMVRNGKLYGQSGQFLIDGELVYCIYNVELEKWVKQEGNKASDGYPLRDMIYDFNRFTFNKEDGTYRYKLGADQGFTSAQISEGKTDVVAKFIDEKCVYFRMPIYLYGFDSISVTEYELYDYGKTTVPVPDIGDIIDAPVTTAPDAAVTTPAA